MSKADRDFLKHLAFREAGDHGRLSWIYTLSNGHCQLVVWTLMNTWERAPFIKARRTILRLSRDGLICVESFGRLPAPFDKHEGACIGLTDKGRVAMSGIPVTE